jgi:(p)ppGpp synthase/HD superfamily hydrolase
MNSYVPFLTRRFYVALQFASELHDRDHRKAIGALLHEVVEKRAGGLSTWSTIRELFGTRVAKSSAAQ